VRVKIAIGIGFALGLVFARTGMNAQNPLIMMLLCPAYWIFGQLRLEDPGIGSVVLGIFLINALVFAAVAGSIVWTARKLQRG
jgi:xanthine/uracil/vitamin C permease (AzgA family)